MLVVYEGSPLGHSSSKKIFYHWHTAPVISMFHNYWCCYGTTAVPFTSTTKWQLVWQEEEQSSEEESFSVVLLRRKVLVGGPLYASLRRKLERSFLVVTTVNGSSKPRPSHKLLWQHWFWSSVAWLHYIWGMLAAAASPWHYWSQLPLLLDDEGCLHCHSNLSCHSNLIYRSLHISSPTSTPTLVICFLKDSIQLCCCIALMCLSTVLANLGEVVDDNRATGAFCPRTKAETRSYSGGPATT